MIMDRLQWILCLMFCLTIIVCCLPLCEAEIVPIYYYKRYSYKKKQKNVSLTFCVPFERLNVKLSL